MKVSETVEKAIQFCKTRFDTDASGVISQTALNFQIEDLIRTLQSENQRTLDKSDIRAGHLSKIERLLESRPIEQPTKQSVQSEAAEAIPKKSLIKKFLGIS